MELTGNQKVAKFVLGYIPNGWVCCASGQYGRDKIGLYAAGTIYVDGKPFAGVPASLHKNRELPSSLDL